MATQVKASSPPRTFGAGKMLTWITGIVCFGLLGYMLIAIVHQVVVPPPAAMLVLMQDIPLPSGLGATSKDQTNPLAPGVEEEFDHFDFQAYDAATHQLFIGHTGPSPDSLALAHIAFDPKFDGNIIVYNTQQDKLTGIVDIPQAGGGNVQEVEPASGGIVGRIDIPQVAGLVDAPDLGKVFAADSNDNIIYDIDVHTLKATPIVLPANESPDSISYDPDHKLIFVSDPGSPADPDKTMNAARSNENVAVIDPVHDKLLKLINIGSVPLLPGEDTISAPNAPIVPVVPGNIPLYGHDQGLNGYDTGTHMLFVPSSVLPNGDDPNPFLLPPAGTGEFFEINPVTLTIAKEIDLPATCSSPNGLAIDTQQEVGFIGCSDSSPAPQNLFENLVRVDLRTMTVIPTDPTTAKLAPGPDIMVIDESLHILFAGCLGGISIFDEKAGEFHKLSDVLLGRDTHTIAVVDDAQTHETEVFLPIVIGGRPVLRIARYNPNGV